MSEYQILTAALATEIGPKGRPVVAKALLAALANITPQRSAQRFATRH